MARLDEDNDEFDLGEQGWKWLKLAAWFFVLSSAVVASISATQAGNLGLWLVGLVFCHWCPVTYFPFPARMEDGGSSNT